MATVHLLLGTTLIGALTTLFFLYQFLRYRQWRLRDKGRLDHQLPIPGAAFESFIPRFARDDLGPTVCSEVRMIGIGDGAPGSTADAEAIVLALLAKDALHMFEFGTATGRTAYLWARNSPPEATVTTLTLPPDQLSSYAAAPGDTEEAWQNAKSYSVFTRFLYSGTDVEPKITQLYGDSKQFDESAYHGRCDLIFVDGSHALSYVRNDSEKALRMLSKGGVILWHDYRHPEVHRSAVGVFRYLNELHRTLPLVRLGATSLVAYRAPQ